MLARNRSAITGHQVSGLFHERAPFADSRRAHEIKIHPAMNAPLSEMAVHGGVVFVFVVEFA